MKKEFLSLIALVALGMLTSCSCNGLNVNFAKTRPLAEETRQIKGFERIELLGSLDVRYCQADSFSVLVKAPADVIKDVETRVDGNKLVVNMKGTNNIINIGVSNSENVTVYDSFISGEYLGWNSKNLKLVNCTIESLQGMCYIDDLVMENCRLINTTLAFEYSNVEADICSSVGSVFNPSSGMIKAEKIDNLIIEKDKIDPEKTRIICKEIVTRSDKPEWA